MSDPAGGSNVRERVRSAFAPTSRRGRWRQTKALRVLCAGLVGAAVWVVAAPLVRSAGLVPGAPGAVGVVVAVRDVPVGSMISSADVAVRTRPAEQVPETAARSLDAVVGRPAAGSIASGEVVTPARVVGPDQLAGLPRDRLAVAAPVSDPAVLTAVRPGDRVALLVPGTGQAVADAAPVLAVDDDVGGGLAAGSAQPGHLLVALTPEQARALAAATGGANGVSGFVVAVRG